MKKLLFFYLFGMIFVISGFSQTQEGGGTWYNTESRGLNASHFNLPFGTRVRVTNLQNNRAVIVTVDNRIPDSPSRIIDISKAAADNLQMNPQGNTPVRIEVLARRATAIAAEPAAPAPTAPAPAAAAPAAAAPAAPAAAAPAAEPPVAAAPAPGSVAAAPAAPPPASPAQTAAGTPRSGSESSGMVSQTTIHIYGSSSNSPEVRYSSGQEGPMALGSNPALAPNPAVVAPGPAVVAPRPVVVAPRPAVITPRPAVITPRPAVISPRPAVIAPQPAVISPQPMVVAPQPMGMTIVSPQTVSPVTVAPINSGQTVVRPNTVGTITVTPTIVTPTTVGPTTVGPTTVGPTTAGPAATAPTTQSITSGSAAGRFRLQVGDFSDEPYALAIARRLQSAGLNPVYEISGGYYRVVIPGVPPVELDAVTQRINAAGFINILIRTEP